MEIYGLCAYCGKPANSTCRFCGSIVCAQCNPKGFCIKCAPRKP